MSKEQLVTTSVQSICAAFQEWDRRFREDPDDFENFATHLLQGDCVTYGEEAGAYFLNVLEDVSKGSVSKESV